MFLQEPDYGLSYDPTQKIRLHNEYSVSNDDSFPRPHSELDRIEEQLMTREAEVALRICQSPGITELYIHLRTGLVHFFFFFF